MLGSYGPGIRRGSQYRKRIKVLILVVGLIDERV